MCSVNAVSALLTVDEALARVLAHTSPLPSETVHLDDAAGRVLAEDAVAAVDLPRFPSSAMDGFAVRSADTPGKLRIVARISAGRPAAWPLGPGEAMGIATGGVVPDGADAVVPIERVTEGAEAVVVPEHAPAGINVRPRGGDVEQGARVLAAGTILSPSRLAALAAAGIATPRCARMPRVAVLTTGTELRAPGESLRDGEIYESNGLMLAALLSAAGGLVKRHVSVADDAELHRAALERALDADVLVTSGGVSVGPHDLVRATLAELGAEEIFWGVAMRPGKPISFSARDGALVFGLPGNPVSSYVGAVLFVVPALRALQGVREPTPTFRSGVLADAVQRRASRDDYQRAIVDTMAGGVVLRPILGQESHMIVRAAAADALVHIPRGEGELAAGSTVRYLPLDTVGAA